MYTKIRTFKIVQIGTIKLDRIKTRRSLTATNTDVFPSLTGRKTKEWQIMKEKNEKIVFIQANSKFHVEISAVINFPGRLKHTIAHQAISLPQRLNHESVPLQLRKKEYCHNNDNNKKQP